MNKSIMIALATTLAISGQAGAQQVGINAAMRNAVKMKTARDAAPRPAVLKERVSLGDDIITGPSSVDQILLLDRTTFTVGANARVKIDRFVYDPNRSTSAVGASVAKGAFRFMSGKATRGAPGQSAVNTPVGSIGIRGTIFEGAVGADAVRIARGETAVGNASADSEKALLVVLRGPGQATRGDEKPGAIDVTTSKGQVSLDRPGLALFVPGPDQAPIGPFMISDAGLAALHALLRTSPTKQGRAAGLEPEVSPVIDRTFECTPGRVIIIPGIPGLPPAVPGGQPTIVVEPGSCGGIG
jgi:hypothetical protein